MEKGLLLVLDAGNTNTVIGVFKDKKLIADWRIRTERNRTVDEYEVLMDGLLRLKGVDRKSIQGVALACVVPPMLSNLEELSVSFIGRKPLVVEPGIKTGMPLLVDNPREVGADRVVNSVAAYERFRTSLIVIDLGTATTFDAVSVRGEYLGGAIAPGIMISCEALFFKASKLPRVEIFGHPRAAIGKDTVSAMNSGIVYGFAGMIEGMVRRMSKELTPPPKVIATGGLAGMLEKVCDCIEEVDENLTLEGLRIIYDRNR